MKLSFWKRFFIKYVLRPKSHLDLCVTCHSWNPWHHPYTIHAAWCPKFREEYERIKPKSWGDFYKVGMPKDSIWWDIAKLYRK